MGRNVREVKSEVVDFALGSIKLEEGDEDNDDMIPSFEHGYKPSLSSNLPKSALSVNQNATVTSRTVRSEEKEIQMGDSTGTNMSENIAKVLRKPTQKTPVPIAALFLDLPDVLDEAVSVFQVIKECIYGSKYMGSSGDHDALDCDCTEQWSKHIHLRVSSSY